MHRYFIIFAYDGTNYHGWQIQPNGNSVQAELQHALALSLRSFLLLKSNDFEIEVVGAGRTDAGVHARQMAAHFELSEEEFPPLDESKCKQIVYRINRILPRDISVSDVYHVKSDMHARFSAKWRTYHYYIHTDKNPPAGAIMFTGPTATNEYGHVFLASGEVDANGEPIVITSGWNGHDGITTMTLSRMIGRNQYLGWALPE